MTCFQAFTGLKVNVGKIEIVPIRKVRNIQSLANILQCRVGSLPMIYLGMPLATLYKTTSIWNPSLKGWKRSFQAGSGFICQMVVDSPC